MIVNEKHSTIRTAEQFKIPFKTLEKWITAFNKENKCFDADYKVQNQIINDLKHEVATLKRDNYIYKRFLY